MRMCPRWLRYLSTWHRTWHLEGAQSMCAEQTAPFSPTSRNPHPRRKGTLQQPCYCSEILSSPLFIGLGPSLTVLSIRSPSRHNLFRETVPFVPESTTGRKGRQASGTGTGPGKEKEALWDLSKVPWLTRDIDETQHRPSGSGPFYASGTLPPFHAEWNIKADCLTCKRK